LPTHETPTPKPGSKPPVTPVMAMGMLIAALLVLLMMLKIRPANDSQKSNENRAHAALQTELEDLKRQSGMQGGGEPIEEVAARMKKDADSVLLLAEHYKQLLDDSNTNLVKKTAEWLRSEQYRQMDRNELERVKTELQQAKVGGTETEPLRRELADLKTRLEAQAIELASLKQQLATVSEQPSKADLDALQRRFDETLRAKEFFESRAKELEAELAKTPAKEPAK